MGKRILARHGEATITVREDRAGRCKQTEAQAKARPETVLPQRIGRDEMNLAEFPFALLADRPGAAGDTLVFTDTVPGPQGPVERIWTVTGSQEFGLPLAGDELVYVALMEVTREQGFADRIIHITRYDLIRRLGWPDKGGSYRRLQAALDRLLGVTIKAERAFWDNRKRRYVDVGFHIIDDYALYDEQPGRKRAAADAAKARPQSYVAWNQVIFESFKSGYIKHLDTAFYFGLRSALSRRLYRYLDKKRYDGKRHYRINLRKLAFEKLGMSRSYFPSHIKQELRRAHDELQDKGFLESVEYQREGQEELVVYQFASADQPQGRSRQARDPAREADGEDLVQQLMAAGVTRAVAYELVEEFAEQVRLQLEYLPFRTARDTAALLVEAIRGQWAPPASYLQARKQQQEEREAQERERRRREARLRQERAAAIERQAAEAVFAGLPARVRRRIEQQANEEVAAISPVLAAHPDSAAYQALLQDKLMRAVMSQFPADFTAQRDSLWAAEGEESGDAERRGPTDGGEGLSANKS